jgi:hypothetical protein
MTGNRKHILLHNEWWKQNIFPDGLDSDGLAHGLRSCLPMAIARYHYILVFHSINKWIKRFYIVSLSYVQWSSLRILSRSALCLKYWYKWGWKELRVHTRNKQLAVTTECQSLDNVTLRRHPWEPGGYWFTRPLHRSQVVGAPWRRRRGQGWSFCCKKPYSHASWPSPLMCVRFRLRH